MWQLGWEGSLGENEYMYVYDWVPSLFTWNYHNIVNWLCPNTKCTIVNWLCVYKSLQSCSTLCYAADCSLPGSSVHGILQARILERVTMPSFRGILLTQRWSLRLLHLLPWQACSLPAQNKKFKKKWKHYFYFQKINKWLCFHSIEAVIRKINFH